MMNRGERRQLDRDVKKSITVIRSHLAFLNEAGNPKYKLVVQSNAELTAKKLMRKFAFWRRS